MSNSTTRSGPPSTSNSAEAGEYRRCFNASIEDPATFWARAAEAVSWISEPGRVLDDSNPPLYRWFPDGELNTCANALDRHVADGRAMQAALIYDSPVTGSQRTYTYGELLDETARFAGVLRGLGVGKGDRVVVYMPMIPEAVITMLACARIGAVHSVVFGGFAPQELGLVRDRTVPHRGVQADARRRDRRRGASTAALRHRPAGSVAVRAHRGPRPGLARTDGGRSSRRACAGRGDRPAVRALHLGHNR